MAEGITQQSYAVEGSPTGIIIYSADRSARSPEEFDRAAAAYEQTGKVPSGFLSASASKDKFGKYSPSGAGTLAVQLAQSEIPVPERMQGYSMPREAGPSTSEAVALYNMLKGVPLQTINDPVGTGGMLGAGALTALMPQTAGLAPAVGRLGAGMLGVAAGRGVASQLSGKPFDVGQTAVDMLWSGIGGTATEVLTGLGNKYLTQGARDRLQNAVFTKFVDDNPSLRNNPRLIDAVASTASGGKAIAQLSGKELMEDATDQMQAMSRYIQADVRQAVEETINMPLQQVPLREQNQKIVDSALAKIVDRTKKYLDDIAGGKAVQGDLLGALDTGKAGSTARDMLSNALQVHYGIGDVMTKGQIDSVIDMALETYAKGMEKSIAGAQYLRLLKEAGIESGFNPARLKRVLEQHAGPENAQAAEAIQLLGLSPLAQVIGRPPLAGAVEGLAKVAEWVPSGLVPKGVERVAQYGMRPGRPDVIPDWLRPAVAATIQYPGLKQQGAEGTLGVADSAIKSFLPSSEQRRP